MIAAAPAPLALLMQAVSAKSNRLVEQMHPAWVRRAFDSLGPGWDGLVQGLPAPRRSALLARAYGLRWPALTELGPRVHRLALLDLGATRRVLSLFALVARRDGLRRLISRDDRSLLAGHVGETAFQWLLACADSRKGEARPLAVADLGIDRLATHGYRLLCDQGAWSSRDALTFTRLCLPPADAQLPPGGADLDPVWTAQVIEQLPNLFPELAWIFGSDMDRALSASSMVSCQPPTSPH